LGIFLVRGFPRCVVEAFLFSRPPPHLQLMYVRADLPCGSFLILFWCLVALFFAAVILIISGTQCFMWFASSVGCLDRRGIRIALFFAISADPAGKFYSSPLATASFKRGLCCSKVSLLEIFGSLSYDAPAYFNVHLKQVPAVFTLADPFTISSLRFGGYLTPFIFGSSRFPVCVDCLRVPT